MPKTNKKHHILTWLLPLVLGIYLLFVLLFHKAINSSPELAYADFFGLTYWSGAVLAIIGPIIGIAGIVVTILQLDTPKNKIKYISACIFLIIMSVFTFFDSGTQVFNLFSQENHATQALYKDDSDSLLASYSSYSKVKTQTDNCNVEYVQNHAYGSDGEFQYLYISLVNTLNPGATDPITGQSTAQSYLSLPMNDKTTLKKDIDQRHCQTPVKWNMH